MAAVALYREGRHGFCQQPTTDYRSTQDVWKALGYPLVDTPPPEHINENCWDQVIKRASSPVTSSEEPLVAVIGVGYVGINLVASFAKHYKLIAYDVSKQRLADIARELDQYPSVLATADASHLGRATHFLVAVPTLLLPDKQIDTSYLRSAIAIIGLHARPGATIVIESSVAVGMTRQLLAPLMRSNCVKGGMSPERVDPGRVEPPLETIPKIISALDDITPGSLDSIEELYSKVFRSIVKVSKPEVAEMTKLYENCQRMVCIAYANEMADACISHQIDPFEVSSAASTKPFGYMPVTPGVGVGGACIPVNPYYLLANNRFPLLQKATEMTWERPAAIGERVMKSLMKAKGAVLATRRTCVLVVGAGFKPGQSLTAYSPAVTLMRYLLENWEAKVTFADPLVKEEAIPYVPRLDEKTEWNQESLEAFDLILVAVKQPGLDMEVLRHVRNVHVEYCCK